MHTYKLRNQHAVIKIHKHRCMRKKPTHACKIHTCSHIHQEYTSIQIHTYKHTYGGIHTCLYMCTNISSHTNTLVHRDAYKHTNIICTPANTTHTQCAHIQRHRDTNTQTSVNTHAQMRKHTNTHIHTQTHRKHINRQMHTHIKYM